jgi:N-acetylneuraminic acid mutarotase
MWSATGPLAVTFSTALADMSATLLADGKVLLTGGTAAPSAQPCELYDPATNSWTVTGSLNFERSVHTATLLANGRVLVVGGVGSAQNFIQISSAEIYDPAAGTWSLTASLPGPLSNHTATLLKNGQVLVAGGDTPRIQGTAAAQLYVP